ncbi:hypothetical protein K9L27_03985 [Candidatus Gracilibacteria bacterium]|nr:hypothetical protein [Candidatus Gracilibacteria bacterium]
MESFSKAKDWLVELSSEAKFFRENTKPSLKAVEAILDALGSPDEFFEWRVIVAGTAGKGSVCRRTEDVLLRAGKSVVTLISPHLQCITERIRIQGRLISEDDFGKFVLKIKKISEEIQIKPTYYEALVLTGVLAGREMGCEVFVGEIGLGGRFDAVNAVRGKRIAALTFIGEDHMQYFGSLDNMAHEKAGIFTADSVFNISYEKKFQNILLQEAQKEVQFIKGIDFKLGKKLVRKICEKILETTSFEMEKIPMPARWEKIQVASSKNILILDGSHSPPRFEFILPKIQKLPHPRTGIFAMVRNHDPKGFEIILSEFDEIIWTAGAEGHEFWKPEELKKRFEKGIVQEDVFALLKELPQRSTLVSGSFYLCGKIRTIFYPVEKILSQQTEFPK